MPKLHPVLKIIGIAVLVFLVAELMARKLYHPRFTFSHFPHPPVPYTMFERRPLPEIPKVKNEYRVFMFGGSAVAEGNPPLPDLLDAELAGRKIRNTRVYNFGQGTFNSTQELISIVTEGLKREPDMIIMYDGGNDIFNPYLYDPRPGYPFNFLLWESNPLLIEDVNEYPVWSLVALKSRLMREIFRDYFRYKFIHMGRLRRDVGYRQAAWRERIADTYVGNISAAHRICLSWGVKYKACFQPVNVIDEGQSRHYRETMGLIREKMARTRPPVPFYDFSDEFKEHVNNHLHASEEGNRKIAQGLAERLFLDSERP
ncbi:MAG TPA: hypothetical protein PK876_09270 [Elusimicrobiota bacterium]|nr:hypothetical protein [Elusimicrobiota bacterium]